jgi:hypothetical protein
MHNQTEQSWIKNLKPTTLGTGVILECSEDTGAVQKIFVQNITYEQCLHRGKDAYAFKWVPHQIATYEELISTTCNVPISEEK